MNKVLLNRLNELDDATIEHEIYLLDSGIRGGDYWEDFVLIKDNERITGKWKVDERNDLFIQVIAKSTVGGFFCKKKQITEIKWYHEEAIEIERIHKPTEVL